MAGDHTGGLERERDTRGFQRHQEIPETRRTGRRLRTDRLICATGAGSRGTGGVTDSLASQQLASSCSRFAIAIVGLCLHCSRYVCPMRLACVLL